MAPKTFWTFFLKIFGLYLIWQILTLLPSFFSTLVFMFRNDDKLSVFTTLCAIVVIGCTFALIFRLCLFKTDFLIEKLRLNKGFEDEHININIHRSSLLSMAIIVIGGLMLADGVPLLVYDGFQYIQRDSAYATFGRNPSSPWLITNFIKVIIGYFMVTDSRLIMNFIERKRKKAQITSEETDR